MRSVVIAHAFVQGGEESESERSLSTVGGSERVSSEIFEGFHYVALGHLHRAQSFEGGRIRYAGSPLKYSESEATYRKSFSIIDMDSDGTVAVTEHPIEPLRELRIIKATIDEILKAPTSFGPLDDYVMVELQDSEQVFDPANRLRPYFPNLLKVEQAALARQLSSSAGMSATEALLDPLPLFESFVRQIHDKELTPEQRVLLIEACESLKAVEREAQ